MPQGTRHYRNAFIERKNAARPAKPLALAQATNASRLHLVQIRTIDMSRKKSPAAKPPLASKPPPATIAPMTPRRKLLALFGLMLLLWIGMMLVIYFSMVYPHRYPQTPPASTSLH
jgi:hypothetical protein